MEARNVQNAEELSALVSERELSHVKVGVFDIDGVLRGKYMSTAKFLSALKKGFGFCDVVVGWDSDDALYDNVKITGWHTGYPDAPVRLLPQTCRDLPLEDGVFVLGEFSGEAEAVCPRAMLRKAVDRAAGHGLFANAALEFEFFVFEETPHSVRDKGYRDLKSITPGNFGYSVIRNSVLSDLYEDILVYCERMDFPLEGLHAETGPGVLEAAIGVDEIVSAADKAALFKTFLKVLLQKQDLLATFMAKWSPHYPGQSGHLHLSLVDERGESAFFEEAGSHHMSQRMTQFVAGCQALMPEMLALIAPTVNSFTRLVPGAWAPTNATWGVENRTCALRVIPGSPSSQRLEYRVGAADINPYLGLAAVLASGLYGIEQGLELSAPVSGNAYEAVVPPEQVLPATLTEAADRLEGSAWAREVFGDTFVEHYCATRRWEEREFRAAVTDWELKRYFEII